MSDVEKICEQNYQRVRWADEYVDEPEAVARVPSRRATAKAWRKHKQMWTATMACAAACGAGITFLSIGIASMNMAAIITGAVVVLTFLASGCFFETAADHAMEEVIAHE